MEEDFYTSLCYSCTRGRRVASDNNKDKGYVGCTLLMEDDPPLPWSPEDTEAEVIGEGWIDPRSYPLAKETSGVLVNCQLVLLDTTKCKYYFQSKE